MSSASALMIFCFPQLICNSAWNVRNVSVARSAIGSFLDLPDGRCRISDTYGS